MSGTLSTRLRLIFLWAMIGSLSAAALIGAAALLAPQPLGNSGRILGTALIVAGFSIICLICLLVMERVARRWVSAIMWFGMACAAAGGALWIILVWRFEPLNEALFRAAMQFNLLAVGAATFGGIEVRTFISWPMIWARRVLQALLVIALLPLTVMVWSEHDWDWAWQVLFTLIVLTVSTTWSAGLLVIRLRDRRFQWVPLLTIACISVSTSAILLAVWEVVRSEQMWIRMFGVPLILAAAGTIITAVLQRIAVMQRRRGFTSVSGAAQSDLRIQLTCPRCGEAQPIRAVDDRCASCGLRIQVNIEEPRCDCGYLLHGVSSARCPECGREIPERMRWREHA